MDISLIITLAICLVSFTGLWLINVFTKDAGVIDYFWGPGFAVVAAVQFAFHGTGTVFEWVLFLAVTAWALRLAAYLIHRHHGSTVEDGRYLEMRKTGGPNFWWASLFKIFLLQGFLLWVIAVPVHVAFGAEMATMSPLFWLGIAIFIIGFAIEWIADIQLAAGKDVAPKQNGQAIIVAHGLWGRSRHPNYVGEITLWWGLALAAFAMSGAWIAFAGPALLTLIIVAISIPLTEQHMLRTRPTYADYQSAVPKLIPELAAPKKNPQPAE
ncbi:MAG: DUF1295 domain-containing protein [Ahrensia sp.]|nr:DUF1295 domain-containing protein [Ahrensia sp.]